MPIGGRQGRVPEPTQRAKIRNSAITDWQWFGARHQITALDGSCKVRYPNMAHRHWPTMQTSRGVDQYDQYIIALSLVISTLNKITALKWCHFMKKKNCPIKLYNQVISWLSRVYFHLLVFPILTIAILLKCI